MLQTPQNPLTRRSGHLAPCHMPAEPVTAAFMSFHVGSNRTCVSSFPHASICASWAGQLKSLIIFIVLLGCLLHEKFTDMICMWHGPPATATGCCRLAEITTRRTHKSMPTIYTGSMAILGPTTLLAAIPIQRSPAPGVTTFSKISCQTNVGTINTTFQQSMRQALCGEQPHP